MASPIGSGLWTAQLAGRGGSPVRLEVPYASLSRKKVLNNYGTASLQLNVVGDAREACCEAFTSTEPFRDEVILYRDDDLDFAGPIVTQTINAEGGGIAANDLFFWMDQRFLEEDFFGSGDLADVFHRVFDVVYAKDETPNIGITTRKCGVRGVRSFEGEQFQRAADVMREIARTALDFTVVGRTILAGGVEVFVDDTPLLLHDDGVISAEVTREGGNFATDVAVFGGTSQEEGGSGQLVVSTGRATTGVERYGLVQKSFTELLIKDGISADANAAARLEAMQPAPIRVSAVVGPKAAFGFDDLICGRRFDVRLAAAVGCVEVMQTMRLTEVDVSVGASGEQVSISLLPIGESGEA